MSRFWQSFWEIIQTVIIAGVTVFLIRTYLIQPFLVSGASMDPYISHGNYLIVDQLTGRFQEFQRSDIVVFRYPKDPDVFYIKRIIALPGDRVQIRNGSVFVNRERLDQSYLPEDSQTFGNVDLVLGKDEYYVLGDNRDNSSDSRAWGSLPRRYIMGLARLRLYPFDQIIIIKRPAYENN